MKRKYLLPGIIIWILLVLAGFYLYNKPHRNAGYSKTDLAIDAVALYGQYSQNETASNQKYLDKIIEVSGKVTEVHKEGNATSIELYGGSGSGGINCSFPVQYEMPQTVAKGSEVKIKGRCTGFLVDVNLADCVVLK
jgi:hypothetical protein